MATETLRPDAFGEENITWSTSGAGNHHNDVDEAVADGAVSQVWTNTEAYERDLYNLPASSGSGTINFVKVYALVYADGNVNQASLKIACKTGGTAYEGSEETLTKTTWVLFSKQWTDNPGGGAWTWEQIDALQIGIAMRDHRLDPAASSRCTQVYVEVVSTPPVPVADGDLIGIAVIRRS